MALERDFRHLPLPLFYNAAANLHGGGDDDERTIANKANRGPHSGFLRDRATSAVQLWRDRMGERTTLDLPSIPAGIPFLLEIDPGYDADFLRGFGLEVVSEHDNGFVLVASDDANLREFMRKMDAFEIANRSGGSAARIFNLTSWDNLDLRLRHILSDGLYTRWVEIEDEAIYTVDVGIECSGIFTIPDVPKTKEGETEVQFQSRYNTWQQKRDEAYINWDDLRIEREENFSNFILGYRGTIVQLTEEAVIGLPDSFTARISIKGVGIRDLVINYPYVFEVAEVETLGTDRISTSPAQPGRLIAELIPPRSDSPSVCVIDSGIQEGHILLADAIRPEESTSYLPGIDIVADEVNEGGHGTRVAGAILYPQNIPTSGAYNLSCWIQNVRVLNADNLMPPELFPPALLRSIVGRYYVPYGTRIYNHSISGFYPCRLQHMSAWAAEIDSLCYENDILFIQAAGNLYDSSTSPFRLGIIEHLTAGREYPAYLLTPSCRIPNPAQSLQAITVGSISHTEYDDSIRTSFGGQGWPSAFSCTGPGLWDCGMS
jgi:hypothetical protein